MTALPGIGTERETALNRLDKITNLLSSRLDSSWPTPSRNAGSVPVHVTATYHGPESLGYIPGETYHGLVVGDTFYPQDCDALPCPYTLSGFFRLWSDISVSPTPDHPH